MKKSKSMSDLWRHLAFVVLQVLRDNDGVMSLSDVLREIEKRAGDKIPESVKETYGSGAVKWKNKVQFESDSLVKAGLLRKEKGIWYLTAAGVKAAGRAESVVMPKVQEAYREWLAKRRNVSAPPEEDAEAAASPVNLEEYQETAVGGIEDHIRALDPYEFQELCAALLRGMEYHVREVAGRGADGGIDIVAYTDPLGGRPPRLKVQVKHQAGKTTKSVLDRLTALLRDGDVGVIISSGGFVSGCQDLARRDAKHLELIDLPRFIALWREYYNNLSEEDKTRLPLQAVYFLDKKRAVQE